MDQSAIVLSDEKWLSNTPQPAQDGIDKSVSVADQILPEPFKQHRVLMRDLQIRPSLDATY